MNDVPCCWIQLVDHAAPWSRITVEQIKKHAVCHLGNLLSLSLSLSLSLLSTYLRRLQPPESRLDQTGKRAFFGATGRLL